MAYISALQDLEEPQAESLASSSAFTPPAEAAQSTSLQSRLTTSSRKRRSRDTGDEPTSTAKKAKLVQFHPNTDDNGIWATGRKLVSRKLRRQPTPYIHVNGTMAISELVEGFPRLESRQQLSAASSDRADYDDGSPPPTLPEPKSQRRACLSPTRDSRGRCGVIPSNVNGFSTAIPYPRLSIVMTDESGITRAWDVSADVFEDVAVYLEVRSVDRVAAAADLEIGKKIGQARSSNGKGLASSSRPTRGFLKNCS